MRERESLGLPRATSRATFGVLRVQPSRLNALKTTKTVVASGPGDGLSDAIDGHPKQNSTGIRSFGQSYLVIGAVPGQPFEARDLWCLRVAIAKVTGIQK